MTYIFYAAGAVVALILLYFVAGGAVARWLDLECDKMRARAATERGVSDRFRRRGMHSEAAWHFGNAEILIRNVKACQRVAGWLR